MRQYYQGTLDFACALYAVINSLAVTHDLGLARGGAMYTGTMEEIARRPPLWHSFLYNKTDHYWVVRYLLARWCTRPPVHYTLLQPFSSCLLPQEDTLYLENVALYLPEAYAGGAGYFHPGVEEEQKRVWETMADWLGNNEGENRTVIFRFHRFLPQMAQPVVSHWTTGRSVLGNTLMLHDASAEKSALQHITRGSLFGRVDARPSVLIAPESVVLLERAP